MIDEEKATAHELSGFGVVNEEEGGEEKEQKVSHAFEIGENENDDDHDEESGWLMGDDEDEDEIGGQRRRRRWQEGNENDKSLLAVKIFSLVAFFVGIFILVKQAENEDAPTRTKITVKVTTTNVGETQDEPREDIITVDSKGIPLYLYNTWLKEPMSSYSTAASLSFQVDDELTRLRDIIEDQQDPVICEQANLCSCEVSGTDLFTQIHSRAFCLLLAYQKKCTLVDNPKQPGPSNYVNKEKCDYESSGTKSAWNCYFEPISKCADFEVYKSNPFKVLSKEKQVCKVTQNAFQKLRTELNLRKLSDLQIFAAFVSWVMRPNRELREQVKSVAESLGLATHQSLIETMATHLTKRTVIKRRELDLIESIGSQVGAKMLHLATDDVGMKKKLERGRQMPTVLQIDPTEFPSIRKDPEKDEGLLEIAQAIVLSRSNSLVGLLENDFDSVVYELMSTVRENAMFQPLNVQGESYRPCPPGASYKPTVYTANTKGKRKKGL